ncbi:hypothetical protein QW694_08765, partial [Methylobacterium isbiliense]|nr:hypothetical protein [Methylobacterium isbiliense]
AAAAARAAAFAAEPDARTAADAAEAASLFSPAAWREATAILDEALGVGRQAPPLTPEAAGARMAAARSGVAA